MFSGPSQTPSPQLRSLLGGSVCVGDSSPLNASPPREQARLKLMIKIKIKIIELRFMVVAPFSFGLNEDYG
jgi:hypothetical protein